MNSNWTNIHRENRSLGADASGVQLSTRTMTDTPTEADESSTDDQNGTTELRARPPEDDRDDADDLPDLDVDDGGDDDDTR